MKLIQPNNSIQKNARLYHLNPRKKCKTVSIESKKKIQDCIIENLKMPEKYQAI